MPTAMEVKKPMNAFFLYRKDIGSRIKSEYLVSHSSEVSRIAGQLWKGESEEVKRKYRKRAMAEHDQFKAKHPYFIWPSKKTTKHKKSNSITSPISSGSENYDLLEEELNLPRWEFTSAEAILTDFFDF